MVDRVGFRLICGFSAALLALPAFADTQFRVRQTTRNDIPPGKGQCDIRLQVDNEVEVTFRRDTVFVRTLSGQNARDDGSECNAPLPDRPRGGVQFEVKDSRNEIRLMNDPARDGAAVVHIRDSDGGFGRYHFRLSWNLADAGPETRRDDDRGRDFDRRGGDGFVWNNAINYRGPGRGSAVFNDSDLRRLFEANVNIDRGGRVMVSFRTERGRPLVFNGVMMRPEGNRLKADMTSEDGRLHGPMFLIVDDRQNVEHITLEATDGRDRLRLNWDRR